MSLEPPAPYFLFPGSRIEDRRYFAGWGWVLGPMKGQEGLKIAYGITADRILAEEKALPKHVFVEFSTPKMGEGEALFASQTPPGSGDRGKII